MEKTLDNIADLIADGMIEFTPEDFQNELEASGHHFDRGHYSLSAKLIVSATEKLLRHFYCCVNPSDTTDFADSWQQLISKLKPLTPQVSTELLARLESISKLYIWEINDTPRELPLIEVEYLNVSCIDICERIIVHPKYSLAPSM